MIRNFIFDWSGTLVDDLPAVWRATNFVFRQAGIPDLSLAEFRAEFRLPFQLFYDRFTPHVPMKQLEFWFHTHFRQVQDQVRLLPHARDFLEFCRSKGLRSFILSTMREDHFRVQATQHGLADYFEKLYLGVWDKRARILDILQQNRLVAQETLFVGDMEHDMETARQGGTFSCAVLTGYNQLDQLQRSKPDLIVEHLGELQALLEMANLQMPLPNSASPLPQARPEPYQP